MNYIIYDIEATCWPGKPARYQQETIELGAFLLSGEGEILDDFQAFVRPIVHPMLSPFCKDLTNISQPQVNSARTFQDVSEDFLDFIGYYDHEDYLLCSWGNFDAQQLRRDCRIHDLEDDWIEPNIDLRKQYQQINRLAKPRGLAKSVRMEGYDWHGDHHRAQDDALNLVQIFREYIDEWAY